MKKARNKPLCPNWVLILVVAYMISVVVSLVYYPSSLLMAYCISVIKLIAWLPIILIFVAVPCLCIYFLITERKYLFMTIFMSLFCLPFSYLLWIHLVYPPIHSIVVGAQSETVTILDLKRVKNFRHSYYKLIYYDEKNEEKELSIGGGVAEKARKILNQDNALVSIEIFADNIIGIKEYQ